jgi:hypothetical protein
VELLVRAAHDRALSDGAKLFGHLAAQPAAGQFRVMLAATPGRAAREALLAVRFCSAEVQRPEIRPVLQNLPAQVALSLIEVREIKAPRSVEPVCWRLLTSHRVDSFATARWIAGLYQQRWIIEELFRTLKTRGFDIERVAIAEGPFEKLAAAALVAAVSVMQLVRDRDGRGKRPLEDVFEPHEFAMIERVSSTLEGKTDKQKNPHLKDLSPLPPGSAQGSADGPAITESPAPSSFSKVFSTSEPCSTVGASPKMCESRRATGRGPYLPMTTKMKMDPVAYPDAALDSLHISQKTQ